MSDFYSDDLLPNESSRPAQEPPRMKGSFTQGSVPEENRLNIAWEGDIFGAPGARIEEAPKKGIGSWLKSFFGGGSSQEPLREETRRDESLDIDYDELNANIERWANAIKRRPEPPIRISPMSGKGGSTKSTVSQALGNAYGRYGTYGVALADCNSDSGTVADTTGVSESGLDITDFLHDIDKFESARDCYEYMIKSPQSRLRVLSSRRGAERSIDGDDFAKLANKFEQFWPLSIFDTGIDFTTHLQRAIIRNIDLSVICSTHHITYLDKAEETIENIIGYGESKLVKNSILSVSSTTPEPCNRDAIRDRFMNLGVRDVVFIPYDKFLGASDTKIFYWEKLDITTQAAYLELAAKMSEMF